MAIARAPLSPDHIATLYEQGQTLADALYSLVRSDDRLVDAMQHRMAVGDYRTIIISVAWDKHRYSIDLYHRSELGMRHLELMKLVRSRARVMKLGLDTLAPEDMLTHASALLVPQKTWLFGSLPKRVGICHLETERLFTGAFILQDLEQTLYSRTMVLDEDQRNFLEEHVSLK